MFECPYPYNEYMYSKKSVVEFGKYLVKSNIPKGTYLLLAYISFLFVSKKAKANFIDACLSALISKHQPTGRGYIEIFYMTRYFTKLSFTQEISSERPIP